MEPSWLDKYSPEAAKLRLDEIKAREAKLARQRIEEEARLPSEPVIQNVQLKSELLEQANLPPPPTDEERMSEWCKSFKLVDACVAKLLSEVGASQIAANPRTIFTRVVEAIWKSNKISLDGRVLTDGRGGIIGYDWTLVVHERGITRHTAWQLSNKFGPGPHFHPSPRNFGKIDGRGRIELTNDDERILLGIGVSLDEVNRLFPLNLKQYDSHSSARRMLADIQSAIGVAHLLGAHSWVVEPDRVVFPQPGGPLGMGGGW